jgi:hypothetical protein
LFTPPGSDDDEDGQPSASNLDAAAPDNPYEHPGCGNELYLDPSEEAMLDMMVLLDSSGTRCSLYDNLLMLLRKHSKKGFNVTKAKGCKSFLCEMRKRVLTPVPWITKVQGQEVVHFSFLEMLHDLLSSTKFQDIDNLCANRDESSHFGKFTPTSAEDCSEIMARDWANNTFESLEDFDPDNDFFLPLVLYRDKTGTDINQRYPLEPWMFTTHVLHRHARESAESWHHLGFIPSLDDAVIQGWNDTNRGINQNVVCY